MDFGFYEIDAWGEQLPGASAPRYCTLSGIAKLNSEGAPYAVPNEFICGRLGLIIGLPVPPGVVVTTDNGKLAYVSLRFGPKGQRPPPVIPEDLVADKPSLAAGIIAFDCWIGNEDRHQENVAYVRDEPHIPATIFDHSHALLGNQLGAAIQRLRDNRENPFVGSGVLASHITCSRHFEDWANRIGSLSRELIRDICQTVVHEDGISEEECTEAIKFLIYRKERVLDKIRQSKGALPNVQQWRLDES